MASGATSTAAPVPYHSMSTRALSKELSSLAKTWTKDPFRPNIQLSSFLKSLAAHPRLTKRAVEDAHSLQNNEMMKKVPIYSCMSGGILLSLSLVSAF